jgi:hypothetical protein
MMVRIQVEDEEMTEDFSFYDVIEEKEDYQTTPMRMKIRPTRRRTLLVSKRSIHVNFI